MFLCDGSYIWRKNVFGICPQTYSLRGLRLFLTASKNVVFLHDFFIQKIMKNTIIILPLLLSLVACGQNRSISDLYETDSFTTKSGKTLKIHALIHSSIRIEFDGKEIEIDPVHKLGDFTIDYAAFPKADYIFVTHEHFDHLDSIAIQALSQKTTQLVTNRRSADQLGYGTVMANGDRLVLNDWLTVEAVPAYNTTAGHLQFHPKGRDNGFILTIDGLRIYIAGDTEDIPEMADIKDIDVAFLPCNQPYTMTVEQLVRAAKIIRPKVLFPYHYNKTKVSVIPELLKEAGIDVRIRHYE